MKAVIMAGGRGTRIASMRADVPKPMIPLCGLPILAREIEVLAREGFREIFLVTGHLGAVIRDYFGDGASFGVKITYTQETEPLGTAGGLALLRDALAGEDFLLLNGDLLFDVDFSRFLAYHRAHGGLATVLVHPNGHPHDSAVIRKEADGRVTAWQAPEEARGDVPNCVNAGLHFLSPAILDRFDTVIRRDLDRDVLRPLIGEGALYAYPSPEYVADVGTPERFCRAEADLTAGIPAKRALHAPQRAVFLDRDGTVNEHVGFLTDPRDLRLCEGAAEAIRAFNEAGFLTILVTNQPQIARGELTVAGLRAIHDKLETLLGAKGAYLNDIYYCPHHPDSGFAGEIPALKINCTCRKPNPGMLLAAEERYHIDLSRSFIIGDRAADCEAGRRAGCRTAFITSGCERVVADFSGASLFECATKILESEKPV